MALPPRCPHRAPARPRSGRSARGDRGAVQAEPAEPHVRRAFPARLRRRGHRRGARRLLGAAPHLLLLTHAASPKPSGTCGGAAPAAGARTPRGRPSRPRRRGRARLRRGRGRLCRRPLRARSLPANRHRRCGRADVRAVRARGRRTPCARGAARRTRPQSSPTSIGGCGACCSPSCLATPPRSPPAPPLTMATGSNTTSRSTPVGPSFSAWSPGLSGSSSRTRCTSRPRS